MLVTVRREKGQQRQKSGAHEPNTDQSVVKEANNVRGEGTRCERRKLAKRDEFEVNDAEFDGPQPS